MAGKIIPYKGMRKVIGDRMRASLSTMAQANHRIHTDMSAVMAFRENRMKTNGFQPGYMEILIAAVAHALHEHPAINSELTEEGIVLKEEIDIGVAVAIPDGLMVPVLRGCDQLQLEEIGTQLSQLVERSRIRRLSVEETTGGSLTITNLGMYGIEGFTAIVNPPQVAILAVGAILMTPVVRAENIVIRPMMELSLTYDHRVVDGKPAALFLTCIRDWLESMQCEG